MKVSPFTLTACMGLNIEVSQWTNLLFSGQQSGHAAGHCLSESFAWTQLVTGCSFNCQCHGFWIKMLVGLIESAQILPCFWFWVHHSTAAVLISQFPHSLRVWRNFWVGFRTWKSSQNWSDHDKAYHKTVARWCRWLRLSTFKESAPHFICPCQRWTIIDELFMI